MLFGSVSTLDLGRLNRTNDARRSHKPPPIFQVMIAQVKRMVCTKLEHEGDETAKPSTI